MLPEYGGIFESNEVDQGGSGKMRTSPTAPLPLAWILKS
jgi:hypothetical protein